MWRAVIVGLFVLMTLSASARADTLTAAEVERLGRGETVVRPETFTISGRRYVGGVTYTVLDTSGEELLAMVDDESTYLAVLPRAKFAKRIPSDDSSLLMEMHHGNALVDAVYTMRLEKDARNAKVRFWIDLARPHDVEDAWGYFRFAALPEAAGSPRVLLTYGVLVDLGHGVLRSLYEDRVKGAMLAVPQLLRRHVARHGAKTR